MTIEDEFTGSFGPAKIDRRLEERSSFFERILRFLERENPLQPSGNWRASAAIKRSEDKN